MANSSPKKLTEIHVSFEHRNRLSEIGSNRKPDTLLLWAMCVSWLKRQSRWASRSTPSVWKIRVSGSSVWFFWFFFWSGSSSGSSLSGSSLADARQGSVGIPGRRVPPWKKPRIPVGPGVGRQSVGWNARLSSAIAGARTLADKVGWQNLSDPRRQILAVCPLIDLVR
jgi:hypothetical protein